MESPSIETKSTTLVHSKASKPSYRMFLNNIDQRFGFFCRNIYFYPAPSAEQQPSSKPVIEHIKSSMEQLLEPYYFISGRFQRNPETRKMEIFCNNQGALLVEATASITIDDAVNGSAKKCIDLEQLVHFPNEAQCIEEMPLFTVQVTSFKCKGFVIGILVHHGTVDATSAMNLLLNFSSISRSGKPDSQPNEDRTYFKARNPPRPMFSHDELNAHPDLESSRYSISLKTVKMQQQPRKRGQRRTFHFSPTTLDALKKSILGSGDVYSCSTFEALAAYVWRAHTLAAKSKSTATKTKSTLRFFLDVRNIVQPALGPEFCGNAIYCVNAEAKIEDMETKPLAHLVDKIQRSRRLITDDYIRSGWDFLELNPNHWYVDNCDLAINAWPRITLGAMDLDFGWGKPVRTEFPLDPGSSTVVFFPVPKGGVDVSLCVDDDNDDQDHLFHL